MKRSEHFSRHIRLILTLSWRILAICVLFLLFYSMKRWSLSAMQDNPYMRNVSGFWDAELLLRAVFYLSFLMYSSLSFVFKLYDAPYCRRVLAGEKSIGSFFTQCRAILLRGYEFWVEAAVLSLWVLFSASDVFFFDLVGGFYADLTVSKAHWITVGIMIPTMILLTFLAHLAAVSWWARKPEMADMTVRRLVFAFLKQLIFTCVMYLLLAFVLTPLYPMLDTFGKVLNIHPLLFLIPLTVALIIILSYRYLRALFARYRFMKELIRICHGEHYRLSDCTHLYTSVFSHKEGISFHLSTGQGDYACKLICSLRRKTPLFFDESGNVSYTVSYGLFGLDFFTDTISARHAFESTEKKLLIISPAVDHVYVTDGKARRRLESGDRIMEYLLYNGEDLLRALAREGL